MAVLEARRVDEDRPGRDVPDFLLRVEEPLPGGSPTALVDGDEAPAAT